MLYSLDGKHQSIVGVGGIGWRRGIAKEGALWKVEGRIFLVKE